MQCQLSPDQTARHRNRSSRMALKFALSLLLLFASLSAAKPAKEDPNDCEGTHAFYHA